MCEPFEYCESNEEGPVHGHLISEIISLAKNDIKPITINMITQQYYGSNRALQ